MNASKISLALFAVALAGCASKTAETPTAPETTDNSTSMMAPASNEVASNAMPSMATNSVSETTSNSSAAASDKYRVRGQVTEVMPADANGEASLMVKHENIPDFMEAMTMRFPLSNAADAGKVKAGDKIVFDVKKGNTEVSNIEMLPPSTELKLAP